VAIARDFITNVLYDMWRSQPPSFWRSKTIALIAERIHASITNSRLKQTA
jgi:hypothetical protein